MVADDAPNNATSYFIEDVKDDLKNPAASEFSVNIDSYKQVAHEFFENLDLEIEGLQKFKKCSKALYDSGQEFHKCEQELVLCLDQIAGNDTACNSANGLELDISAAWLKFCVIFKDLSILTRSLCQSIKNNLIFPTESLLKSNDIKDRSDFKKNIDKAFKDYESKKAKCEKMHKSTNSGHLLMSKSDLAENLMLERTSLQFELCKFFNHATKIRSKKGTELLQHLVDFYHTQESFYREGLRTVEEFRSYVEKLIEKLNSVKRKQDEERKHLKELTEELEKSPYLRETDKADCATFPNEMISSVVSNSMEPSTSLPMSHDGVIFSRHLSGYLMKQSAHKMHKSWLKRKCQVQDGSFITWHSDESRLPLTINLLTCQIRADKNDKKCFDLVCPERTYHFQAENEQSAKNWMAALTSNHKLCQMEVFHNESDRSPYSISFDKKLTDSLILRINNLPDNDRCCDCDSTKDVTWISINLGAVYCIDCSGIHRELGVQTTRIQSLTLDYSDVATLLVPLVIGNKNLNEIFEAKKADLQARSKFTSRTNTRKGYITSKYIDKKYVDKVLAKEELVKILAQAAKTSSVKTILYVYANGIDLNCILDDNRIENALFIACRNDENGSHLPCIQFLIQNGADVNRVNSSGDTVLHLAVRLNKPDVINLISLGRNVRFSFLNAVEETPKQLAHRLNHIECETLLASIESNDRSILGNVKLPSFLSDGVENIEAKKILVEGVSVLIPPASPQESMKCRNLETSFAASTSPLSQSSGSSERDKSTGNSSDTANNTPRKHIPAGAKLVLPRVFSSPRCKDSIAKKDCESCSPISPAVPVASVQESPTSPKDNCHVPKPIPRQRLNSKPLIKRCRALYDCKADRVDELSFNRGDVIIVTKNQRQEENDNWLEGYVETRSEKIGLFPVTFVTFEK